MKSFRTHKNHLTFYTICDIINLKTNNNRGGEQMPTQKEQNYFLLGLAMPGFLPGSGKGIFLNAKGIRPVRVRIDLTVNAALKK